MILEKKLLSDLVPADYNPRKALKPGDAEYEKLKRSIQQFGFVEPIIWNKRTGLVVGGHQRLSVLKDLGVTEVDCVVVDFDHKKEAALNVALNKISGSWDDEKLQALFSDLELSGFDTSLTGFEPVEIEGLFQGTLKETMRQDSFDSEAAAKEAPFVKPGDLWLLGEHRLFCGQFAGSAAFIMNGLKANLFVSEVPKSADEGFCRELLNAAAAWLDDGASIYVFHNEANSLPLRVAFDAAGFRLSTCCVWKAPKLADGDTPYGQQHVPCLFGWKASGTHKWYADRKQTTVWEIDATAEKAELPIPVVGYPVINSSMRNSIVLDPFGGSGSTLIACEQTGRICYTIELDEKFVDVIVNRYIAQVGSSEGVRVVRDGETLSYEEVQLHG